MLALTANSQIKPNARPAILPAKHAMAVRRPTVYHATPQRLLTRDHASTAVTEITQMVQVARLAILLAKLALVQVHPRVYHALPQNF